VAYERETEQVQDEIDRAQKAHAAAYIAVGKGTGSVADYNRTGRKLADLEQKKWRISAGLVSDER
jgi:hypothetical protein